MNLVKTEAKPCNLTLENITEQYAVPIPAKAPKAPLAKPGEPASWYNGAFSKPAYGQWQGIPDKNKQYRF